MILLIGCAGELPLEREEAVEPAIPALEVFPHGAAGTWVQDSRENCLDICGRSCDCIADRCSGTESPAGESCSPASDPCHFVVTGSVFTFRCTGPARMFLNVQAVGQGSVSGRSISCPGDCFGDYVVNTNVALTATPGAGHSFFGWSTACGAGDSTNPTITIAVTQDRNCTAFFAQKGF